MKRLNVALTPFVLVAITATTASAQETGMQPLRRQHFESPQRFALELRFSPYWPDVDSEPALGGKTPLRDTFGSGALDGKNNPTETSNRVLFAVEFDWQALRIPHFGTLGPGVSLGYTSLSGQSYYTDGTRPAASQPSLEETTLSVMPMYGVGVLRADVLWRDLGIPIVPYGKAGIGAGYWSISNPGGTASYLGKTARGLSWGTHFALGGAFALDVIDRTSARDLDTASGINHTYFYFEYFWSTLNGFGDDKSLRVGTKTWALGLAFEF